MESLIVPIKNKKKNMYNVCKKNLKQAGKRSLYKLKGLA